LRNRRIAKNGMGESFELDILKGFSLLLKASR
jgi:hypothetical protein